MCVAICCLHLIRVQGHLSTSCEVSDTAAGYAHVRTLQQGRTQHDKMRQVPPLTLLLQRVPEGWLDRPPPLLPTPHRSLLTGAAHTGFGAALELHRP